MLCNHAYNLLKYHNCLPLVKGYNNQKCQQQSKIFIQNLVTFIKQIRIEQQDDIKTMTNSNKQQKNLDKTDNDKHINNINSINGSPKQQSTIQFIKIDGLCIHDISIDNFQQQTEHSFLLAHIYWTITYKFVSKASQNKNELPTVVAQTLISNKSWINPHGFSKRLLQHQYGHYLIGCWCALDFQTTVNQGSKTFMKGSNVTEYHEWCRKIFREKLNKYCEMEKQYDRQTCHYCNQQKQAEWEQSIVRNINLYYKNSQNRKITERNCQQNQIAKQNRINRRPVSHKSSRSAKKDNVVFLPKISLILDKKPRIALNTVKNI